VGNAATKRNCRSCQQALRLWATFTGRTGCPIGEQAVAPVPQVVLFGCELFETGTLWAGLRCLQDEFLDQAPPAVARGAESCSVVTSRADARW
jgi:hypothetical protein